MMPTVKSASIPKLTAKAGDFQAKAELKTDVSRCQNEVDSRGVAGGAYTLFKSDATSSLKTIRSLNII
jgi:hypothetical protein